MKKSIIISIAILLTSLIAPAKNKAPQFVLFDNTHGVTLIKLIYPGKECNVSEAFFSMMAKNNPQTASTPNSMLWKTRAKLKSNSHTPPFSEVARLT